jgi:uncharacterized protein involved in exopolysaccharide biosynthesis
MTQTQLQDASEDLVHPGPLTPRNEASAALRSVLRSWWIIVLCALIAVGVGLGIGSNKKATYQAGTYVLLNTSNFQQAVIGFNPSTASTQVATAEGLLTPQREVEAAMKAGMSPGQDYSISVNTTSANSNVLVVEATTRNPRTAAALADAAAEEMISVIKQSNNGSLTQARAVVKEQLRFARRVDKRPLATQLNTFQTLEALADQSMQIIQRATLPGPTMSMSKIRIAAIALVLGLLLGLGIALLRRERTSTGHV